MVRIGDEAVAGIVGKLGRFGLDMGAGCAERVHGLQVEVSEDVQHQDRRGALAVRRMLDKVDAVVETRDRGGVVAGGRGKVVQGVGPAKRAQRGDHVLGHLALVESGAALPCDAAQDLGLSRGAEDLAHGRRLAAQGVEVARGALEAGQVVGPVEGDAGGDGDAFLGIVDCGGEDFGQRFQPVVGVQTAEGVDGAGERHGLDRLHRHRGQAPGPKIGRVQARRRPARSVQRDDVLRPGGFQ